MYTGRVLKSNIEWILIRIQRARNRSRLGKSSIIFKSLCWSSRALLCGGIALVQIIHPHDMKIPLELKTIEDILLKSDILLERNHLKEAKDVLDEYTEQELPEIKWRQARCSYLLSKQINKINKNDRNSLILDAYEFIKIALEKCDKNSEIHKWMAIILDAKLELGGVKERISRIYDIRKHMESAINLNPYDPISWYFLGVYEFDLADLSWLHKKILSIMTHTNTYNLIPNGSYRNALEYFQYAENLKPGFYLKNLLMLGKCSIALQKLNDAKQFLRKVTNFQVINREDQHCQKEAVELLKRIGTIKSKQII